MEANDLQKLAAGLRMAISTSNIESVSIKNIIGARKDMIEDIIRQLEEPPAWTIRGEKMGILTYLKEVEKVDDNDYMDSGMTGHIAALCIRYHAYCQQFDNLRDDKIDWEKLEKEFEEFIMLELNHKESIGSQIFNWFKSRLSKGEEDNKD